MSLYSVTLSQYQSKQALLWLLNDACLAEKQQIPIYNLCFDSIGLELTTYRTRGEHADHCITDAVNLDPQISVNSQ